MNPKACETVTKKVQKYVSNATDNKNSLVRSARALIHQLCEPLMPSSASSVTTGQCRLQVSRDSADTLFVALQGRLDEQSAPQLISEFSALLNTENKPQVFLDLGEVDQIDDLGVAVLVGFVSSVANRDGRLRLENVTDDVDKMLLRHNFNALCQPEVVSGSRKQTDTITSLGGMTLDGFVSLRNNLVFLGDTCISLLRVCTRPRLLRGNDTIQFMQKVGVDALPIVGLISFLLGLIMAFMSSVQLAQFGANIYVASLVSLSMTRELGPIMTAIIVAGRSGSAFAAEIGTMKISEEVDALYTMGIDPHVFLVMPRLIATVLVMPLLTLFSDLFAIMGGLLVGVSMLDLTFSGYIAQTIRTLDLFDVFWGFGKAGVFALLISWTGCLRGFQVEGGAAGVGRATTSAVVSSIFLIILSDSLLVVMLRYWEG